MKKNLLIFGLIAATAVVFSCSKEPVQVEPAVTPAEETEEPTPVTPAVDGNLLTSFGVTFEGDTKVTVDLSDGETEGETEIEVNDEVLVFVDADNKAIYKYNGTNFVLKDGETAVTLSNTAQVFYPADKFEVSVSGNNVNVLFTMPNGVEATGDFGAIAPMAGVIEEGENPGTYTVELCNIASVLRVKVTADVNINSVTLDYGSMVYYATGSKYFVDASAKTMTYSSDASDYTNETVELGTPALTADVLFIVPTIGLANGLTVTANLAENHNGGADTFTVTNANPDARARNTISTMNFKAKLFDGGLGTSESPYLIASAKDFKYIQKYTSEGYTAGGKDAAHFLSAYYKQTANIIAGAVTPIGTSSAPFTGHYDAINGEKTFTLDVNIDTSTDNTGVFGYINNATISNLTVAGTVKSSAGYTAGVAGIMAGSSVISGCTNQAVITNTNSSNSFAAGIVGKALGTSSIISCVNKGYINATKPFVAGIVGDMTGTVDKCINSGVIDGGSSNVGGIAGALRASSIVRRCYSSKGKEITGQNRVGGIVGNNAGIVANCFSNSNVTGTSNTANYGVGGLVGALSDGLLFNSATGEITVKCSATCTNKDNAKVNVGGLVGRQTGGTIQNVYSPLYAKDIKIGSIHGRDGSGKIGQIVGVVTTAGTLCAYYFGGCSDATTGWQYWGTNEDSNNTNRDGQWAFTSASNVSMDWTKPVAKNFTGFDTSFTSGNYHLCDVLNIDKSSSAKYSAYTPVEGEVITWSDLSASDYHPIPDELMNLGEDYYKN